MLAIAVLLLILVTWLVMFSGEVMKGDSSGMAFAIIALVSMAVGLYAVIALSIESTLVAMIVAPLISLPVFVILALLVIWAGVK